MNEQQQQLIPIPPRPSRPGHSTARKTINLLTNWYLLSVRTSAVFQYQVIITQAPPPPEALQAQPSTSKAPPPKKKGRETDRPLPPNICRAAMDHLSTELKWTRGTWAFDGRETLYALVNTLRLEDHFVTLTLPGERRKTYLKVSLLYTADVSNPATVLKEYFSGVRGAGYELPQKYIQALDIILRHQRGMESFSKPSVMAQGNAFLIESNARDRFIGEGAEAWRGYRQSVRVCEKGIAINVDLAIGAVWQSKKADGSDMTLAELMVETLGRQQRLNPVQKKIFWSKKFRGLKVAASHNRFKRVVQGFSDNPPHKEQFTIKEDGKPDRVTNVAAYFLNHYNITIKNKELPCVKVGQVLLPPEVCIVLPKQRCLVSDEQASNMIRQAQTKPQDRVRLINQYVDDIARGATAEEKTFDIGIDKKMIEVTGRVLPNAVLDYGNKRDMNVPAGSWNLAGLRLAKSARLDSWAVLSFNFRDRSMQTEQRFINDFLIKEMKNLGLTLPPQAPRCIIGDSRSDNDVERSLRGAIDAAQKQYKRPPQFVLVVLPDTKSQLYRQVKRAGDSILGVVTQCVLFNNIRKDRGMAMYCANVILKLNSKLAGTGAKMSATLAKGLPPCVRNFASSPFMVLGADVTHPALGSMAPSVAALVGSMDGDLSQYVSRIRSQLHRKGKSVQEIILDMETMVSELLREFARRNAGKYPNAIIMYRDGVSEGQFDAVLLEEYPSMRRACTAVGGPRYVPKITFVVVQKRHQTRFFPVDPQKDGDRTGNVKPGTVVDNGITHPTEHDFYLNSQAGLLGTNRPAHYHVLVDENGFSADGLHQFTYWSTYTFARCTRSISVPPAARYAHLAAFRGRALLAGGDVETGSVTSASSGEVSLMEVNSKIAQTMFYV